MKKGTIVFVLISILLISCNKEYKYTVYKVNPENKYDSETKTEIITAKDDLEAYQKGATKFTSSVFSSKVLNKKAMHSYRSKIAERYSLLNKKGENISDLVDSKKREETLKALLNIIKEDAKKYDFEIEDSDIIGRDRLQ